MALIETEKQLKALDAVAGILWKGNDKQMKVWNLIRSNTSASSATKDIAQVFKLSPSNAARIYHATLDRVHSVSKHMPVLKGVQHFSEGGEVQPNTPVPLNADGAVALTPQQTFDQDRDQAAGASVPPEQHVLEALNSLAAGQGIAQLGIGAAELALKLPAINEALGEVGSIRLPKVKDIFDKEGDALAAKNEARLNEKFYHAQPVKSVEGEVIPDIEEQRGLSKLSSGVRSPYPTKPQGGITQQGMAYDNAQIDKFGSMTPNEVQAFRTAHLPTKSTVSTNPNEYKWASGASHGPADVNVGDFDGGLNVGNGGRTSASSEGGLDDLDSWTPSESHGFAAMDDMAENLGENPAAPIDGASHGLQDLHKTEAAIRAEGPKWGGEPMRTAPNGYTPQALDAEGTGALSPEQHSQIKALDTIADTIFPKGTTQQKVWQLMRYEFPPNTFGEIPNGAGEVIGQRIGISRQMAARTYKAVLDAVHGYAAKIQGLNLQRR